MTAVMRLMFFTPSRFDDCNGTSFPSSLHRANGYNTHRKGSVGAVLRLQGRISSTGQSRKAEEAAVS